MTGISYFEAVRDMIEGETPVKSILLLKISPGIIRMIGGKSVSEGLKKAPP